MRGISPGTFLLQKFLLWARLQGIRSFGIICWCPRQKQLCFISIRAISSICFSSSARSTCYTDKRRFPRTSNISLRFRHLFSNYMQASPAAIRSPFSCFSLCLVFILPAKNTQISIFSYCFCWLPPILRDSGQPILWDLSILQKISAHHSAINACHCRCF